MLQLQKITETESAIKYISSDLIWEHSIISEIMNRNAAKWGLQPVWMLHFQDSGAAPWVSSKETTNFWETLPRKESSKTSAVYSKENSH